MEQHSGGGAIFLVASYFMHRTDLASSLSSRALLCGLLSSISGLKNLYMFLLNNMFDH